MLVIQRPTVEAIGDDHPTRQRFSVGPLEPGFGHTIGNSLRRVLLSSIPGAAITAVRFDDALHEFDTIAGISEDVIRRGAGVVHRHDVPAFTVTADEAVSFQVDGDYLGARSAVSFASVPKALRVVAGGTTGI